MLVLDPDAIIRSMPRRILVFFIVGFFNNGYLYLDSDQCAHASLSFEIKKILAGFDTG
jgi:hypothetical protein